jgi:hypothetical protein
MATAEIKIGQVDDVQELHRTCLTTVPERYVRDGDDRPVGAKVADHHDQIPVIDVGELLPRGGELDKLRIACEEWGFFQVHRSPYRFAYFLKKIKRERTYRLFPKKTKREITYRLICF